MLERFLKSALFVHAMILSCIMLITLVLAALNTYQEETWLQFGHLAFVFLTVASLAGPGVAIAGWLVAYKMRGVVDVAFTVGAYFICVTGCLVYLMYVLVGEADSPQSADHLHVIAFPIFHAVLAMAVLLLAATATGIRFLVERVAGN